MRTARHLGIVVAGSSIIAAQMLALATAEVAQPPAEPPEKPRDLRLLVRLRDSVELVPRAAFLALLFSPLALLSLPAWYDLRGSRLFFYDLLVWTLQRAGCAFIKWGQWAATRPDLFPPAARPASPELWANWTQPIRRTRAHIAHEWTNGV